MASQMLVFCNSSALSHIKKMKVVLLLSLIGVSAGFVLQPSVTMPSSALHYRKEKVEEQSFVEMKKPA